MTYPGYNFKSDENSNDRHDVGSILVKFGFQFRNREIFGDVVTAHGHPGGEVLDDLSGQIGDRSSVDGFGTFLKKIR